MRKQLIYFFSSAAVFVAGTSLLLLPIGYAAEESGEAATSDETLDRKFRELDLDGSGSISSTELRGPLFRRLDHNGDGKILLEEARELLASRDGRVRRGSEGQGAGGSEARRRPASLPNNPMLEALFRGLDKDQSGAISRAEAKGARWFERGDIDGDGEVTLNEALAALGQDVGGDGEPVEPPKPIAEGPEPLKPGELGVGRLVPDLAFASVDGRSGTLGSLMGEQGLVIAMTSSTCPISKRYAPEWARLQDSLAKQEIALLFVNPFASEAEASLLEDIERHGYRAPYVHDEEEALAGALGAQTTTEVFLLDPTRTLVYRGALDDRYGLFYNREVARAHYLDDAIEAMVEGRRPRIAATRAPGCELDLDPDGIRLGDAAPADSVEGVAGPTYHRDVARILQQNCLECHHEGGIAPFALDDFAEVDDRARTIKRVIEDGTMPPWFADGYGSGIDNPWANDRSLSDRDKADLLAWIANPERPKGDPDEAPAPLSYSAEGWQLGEPDAVVAFEEPVQVKAEGTMPYVNLTLPTGFTEDRWVQAIEVLPSEHEVVHHALIWAFEPGPGRRRFSETDGYFGVYVPGTSVTAYPKGFGKLVKAGSHLRIQMHYTPNGTAVEDLTRIGIHFADEPPEYEVGVMGISNPRIRIPAGAPNHLELAHRTLREDITVTGFVPHLHTRGKAFRYEVLTGGEEGSQVLLDIPRYDFNWQLRYQLKEPLFMPKGTRLQASAWYDNSASNPANPDPSKQVRWGKQTNDEMLIGYVEYYVPRKD